MVSPEPPRPGPALPAPILLGVVFLTGAAVLVVELLSSRVLAPTFGATIEMWGALLTATLVALSAGYWGGGRAVERRPTPALLFGAAGAGGVLVLVTLALVDPILAATEGLGARTGLLAAAMLFVAPPLVVLGAAGPIAVRLHPLAGRESGRAAGQILAWSTLGSVAGALGSAFVLLPAVGVKKILLGTGIGLVLLAAGGLLAGRRARPAAAALLLGALGAAVAAREPEEKALYAREGPYGQVVVAPHEDEIWLLLNGMLHTHVPREDPTDVRCEYVRGLSLVFGLAAKLDRVLVIGGGGGALPRLLPPGAGRVEIVEIDPVVVEAAERHFGRVQGTTWTLGDGRRYLAASAGDYDVIVLDTVSSEFLPEHLSSLECFRLCREKLRPDGVLGMNFVGVPGGPAAAAIHRTLREVFPHVAAVLAHADSPRPNFEIFASARPLDPPGAIPDLEKVVGLGEVLTDDWNPVNSWEREEARASRAHIRAEVGRALVRPR
ncbi:MAG: fused MFS/spermidine synthase [Planctomycetales bacterium]|nr:fused MFS/spermidine synthase [Planctomycetales bacterium]